MVCIEAVEQIKRFEEFIKLHSYPELLKNISAGLQSITIDSAELARFDPELTDQLLDEPDEVIKAAELAVLELDLPSRPKDFKVRFKNLPATQKILVRDIRSKHVGKFLSMDGIVRQKSDVRPQVTSARFECPSCGNIISVLQLDTKFKDPNRCGCGRKGKFHLLSKEMVDAQRIVLEESSDALEGGDQPKRMDIFLKHDLVSPLTDRKTNPGTKILVNGVVKEVPITLREGGQSIRFDLLIEANYVQQVEEDLLQIGITPEEEQKIRELAAHPQVYDKLIFALAPSIYGHDRTKEAIILQLVGGCQKKRKDGTRTRGDLHILLIGDPGAGKSMLLKRSQVVAPKSRYVTGKGATGAGLCVAPHSMILTNPGGIQPIQAIVESRLTNPEQVTKEGVLRQQNIADIKIQSLAANLTMQTQHPESLWKLPAPDRMYSVTLSSGKKIEITANTKLLSIADGKLMWKKASEIAEGYPIATPRHLMGGEITRVEIADLIISKPTVHQIKQFVKEIVKKLRNKYGTIRTAAQKIGVEEGNLYYNWVNEKARGNISLGDLKKIAEEAGMPWKEKIVEVSLYKGKIHKLPIILTPELMYVAGLIAGDGDIRPSGETMSIRLSNSELALHQHYQKVLRTEFGLRYDVQQGSKQRPMATRTHSKLLAEIMHALGVPCSPKSDKIVMPSLLLHLSNDFLAQYLAGLYDADGSISIRKTKGSHCIDFTTCSERLAKQLQLVLLRYEIHATLRQRPPSPGKIRGTLQKWVVEIRGAEQIRKFAHHIPLKHPKKKKKMVELARQNVQANTNVDCIPTLAHRLRKMLIDAEMSLKKVGWRKNLSREAIQKIMVQIQKIPTKRLTKNNENSPLVIGSPYLRAKARGFTGLQTGRVFGIENRRTKVHGFRPAPIFDKEIGKEIDEIKRIASSDIFWEKAVSVKTITPTYKNVYDLTVKDSHNFVVDGMLIHNTAAVVRDEFLKGWALEAGALVLANNGFVMIDELDKMSKEDRSAMHEALEQQSVSISKANIQATLRCETTVLAAANPKFGRFDPYELIAKQIDLPPTLINRFDLIFPIKDLPDEKNDAKMAGFILALHKDGIDENVEIDTDLLRRYIAFTRKNVHPVLSDEAIEEIRDYYVSMRNTGQEEGGIRAIPITARQLEALVRLAEASAKVRLSQSVSREDAKRAISLVDYCLRQVGLDKETGKIDIDRISSGITASQRNRIVMVKEVISELEKKLGKTVSVEEIVQEAEARGIPAEQVDEVIEKLKRAGDIFEPKKGFVTRI